VTASVVRYEKPPYCDTIHGVGKASEADPMYEYSDIKFAMCAFRVLGIILVVAVAAFALKSRAVFVAGSLGSFLGYVIPEPSICIDGTAEGCFMGRLDWSASHVLSWGSVVLW